jgi:hypothetical protein
MLPLELARYLAGSVFPGRKLERIWDGYRERSDQRQTNAPHSSIADQRINNSTVIKYPLTRRRQQQRPAKIGSRRQAGELPGDEVEMVFYQGKVSSCLIRLLQCQRVFIFSYARMAECGYQSVKPAMFT